jgi:hypothetical protein
VGFFDVPARFVQTLRGKPRIEPGGFGQAEKSTDH